MRKMYCPICKEFVYPIRHVYPDRVEYVCPKCNRVLEVVHMYGKWYTTSESEYAWDNLLNVSQP